MKSFMANPSNIERKWFVVDATDKTLGRLAAEVAKVLRGKHKPTFTPHMDTGDNVIIVNADKVVLTGKKLTQKRGEFENSPAPAQGLYLARVEYELYKDQRKRHE